MGSEKVKKNLETFKILNREELKNIEKMHRVDKNNDHMPWAKGTPFLEIAESIITDKKGSWSTPLFYTESYHRAKIGMQNLCYTANEYLNEFNNLFPIDILSISTHMEEGKIVLNCLVRPYSGNFSFNGFFDYVGDEIEEEVKTEIEAVTGKLVVPDEIKNFSYTEEEKRNHAMQYGEQMKVFRNCDIEHPFLNSIRGYTPEKLPTPSDTLDLVYDLMTSDRKVNTIATYEQFTKVFREVMSYVNGVEYYHYVNVLTGEEPEATFMAFLKQYVEDFYVKAGKLDVEDVPQLMDKLNRSLFKLYIVQDLIDDPNVTDIKITAPNAIRARVKGKAYMSNIHFIDEADYKRFVNMLAIRNNISQNVPSQTFTDIHDERYILRFSLYAQYVNSEDWPYVHIRKIDRKKLLSPELLAAGMFDEKIRDYLLDCGKTSRGVVFAGPPGSGKTVCMNWFLEEAYEQSAEILVIQENDELFCYRKGVMFQHVVNYAGDNQSAVSLEQLGQLALVAGANVFVIGEAKGAEICSAITLSNSGCRTAITIHSPSSTETLDKMADLAMRGYATDYVQAKRMLKSFQTIVYIENFKIREISEIIGFDEETQDMIYRYIYRDPEWFRRGAIQNT